jgi:hypothetical protein
MSAVSMTITTAGADEALNAPTDDLAIRNRLLA